MKSDNSGMNGLFNKRISLRISRRSLIIIMLLVILVFGCFVLPPTIEIVMALTCCIAIAVIMSGSYARNDKKTVSLGITLPLVLSITQNVYLGIAAYKITELELQVLLSLNFIIYLLYIICYIFRTRKIQKRDYLFFIILVLISAQGIVLYSIYPTGIGAFMASYRNIISCVLIFWVVAVYSDRIDIDVFDRVVFFCAWAVVVFGLYEYFVGNGLWKLFNIDKLWDLKGIGTNSIGIPNNWYSSEMIGGHQIRRMVSLFADPVNLGTYLFAAFMYAWYRRRKVLCTAVFICSVLTISKGALLGFLFFAVFYAWHIDRSKVLPAIAISFSIAVGVFFISFSRASSTGSVFAHLSGFTSSFGMILQNPFGAGIGRVGTLSWLFSENYLKSAVTETGLGMIIAQLGVLGLALYIAFFSKILKIPKKWGQIKRGKVLYYTLAVAFLVNAMFNEVALSPNSCFLYFALLGVLSRSGFGEAAEMNNTRCVEKSICVDE